MPGHNLTNRAPRNSFLGTFANVQLPRIATPEYQIRSAETSSCRLDFALDDFQQIPLLTLNLGDSLTFKSRRIGLRRDLWKSLSRERLIRRLRTQQRDSLKNKGHSFGAMHAIGDYIHLCSSKDNTESSNRSKMRIVGVRKAQHPRVFSSYQASVRRKFSSRRALALWDQITWDFEDSSLVGHKCLHKTSDNSSRFVVQHPCLGTGVMFPVCYNDHVPSITLPMELPRIFTRSGSHTLRKGIAKSATCRAPIT